MDRYFRWHDMSESRKIRLAVMKLTGQAGQYWKNLKRMMRYRKENTVKDLGRHEREAYVEVRFTVIQSVIVGQVK